MGQCVFFMGKITESPLWPQSKSLANDNDIWKNLNIYFYFLTIRKINFIYELKLVECPNWKSRILMHLSKQNCN